MAQTLTVKGWHPGSLAILEKVGFREVSAESYKWIKPVMPEQHRQFHTHNVPFVPITVLDDGGRPWGAVVAGPSGEPEFITSPTETSLTMDLRLIPGDPFLEYASAEQLNKTGQILLSGISVEFSTRRRNKFTGYVTEIKEKGNLRRELKLTVNQAIGLCPKYINIRPLYPHLQANPQVVYKELHMQEGARLPQEVIDFVLKTDTAFFGSSYAAREENAKEIPSYVGINIRGGKVGFIRVLPSDGRTVFLPDFSGNRMLTSLGNIEYSGLASITFLDFISGDILYLTGTARNLVGSEAKKIMPRQNVMTAVYVTGYIFLHDALPVRQPEDAPTEWSPYSPPVKPLAEEQSSNGLSLDDVKVQLTRMKILSSTLCKFTFETSQPVRVLPGQAAVLSFEDLLGKQEYAHMAPGLEQRINDDRIRTWTISSAHTTATESKPTSSFEITMREKEGGLVTGALFNLARDAALNKPEALDDSRPLGIVVSLVGISGEFSLPILKADEKNVNLLWFAGGIGITPFQSMLAAIVMAGTADRYQITFALSTREPDVMLPLVKEAAESSSGKVPNVVLHLYSPQPPSKDPALPPSIIIQHHTGRVNDSILEGVTPMTHGAYVCGPQAFEEAVIKLLVDKGYTTNEIVREGFAY